MLAGCRGGTEVPEPQGTRFVAPAHFPPVTYTFARNPVTEAGFQLGRMLFYDPILSRDSTVSCASCHLQAKAFTDPIHRLSVGVDDRRGTRNAPAIQNLAFREHFFWDGGVGHVDFISVNPIENEVEMDEAMGRVVQKLRRHADYVARFRRAFGTDSLDSRQVLHALSQFMVMLVSADAPYDRAMRGEALLTTTEAAGQRLFLQACGSCHPPPLFTDDAFRNNGLDTDFAGDPGRARITELPEDRGKFHVPSLRNVALTAPYMHDGRFSTLDDVLDHYGRGIRASPTLDPLLHAGGTALTAEERQQLLAFLHTFTDRTFTHDARFADPF